MNAIIDRQHGNEPQREKTDEDVDSQLWGQRSAHLRTYLAFFSLSNPYAPIGVFCGTSSLMIALAYSRKLAPCT